MTYPRVTLDGTETLRLGKPWLSCGYNYGKNKNYGPSDVTEDACGKATSLRDIMRGWGDYPSADCPDGEEVGAPGHWARAYIEDVHDPIIETADNEEIEVLLARDANCGSNAHTGMPECTINGKPDRHYWNCPPKRAHFLQQWRFAARRYRRRFYSFEPFVEPVPHDDSVTVEDMQLLQEQVMDIVFDASPGAIATIGGRGYGTKNLVKCYKPEWRDRYPGVIQVTCNMLTDAMKSKAEIDERVSALDSARDVLGVPVHVQQIGNHSVDDPGNELLIYALEQLVDRRIGFHFWEKHTPDPKAFGAFFNQAGRRVVKPVRRLVLEEAFRRANASLAA